MKNEYFEEISVGEWLELLHNVINFNESNIKYIGNFYKIQIKDTNAYKKKFKSLIMSDYYFRLIELEDEWFLVDDLINDIYYKCDQLDGVIECLKYMKSKIKVAR